MATDARTEILARVARAAFDSRPPVSAPVAGSRRPRGEVVDQFAEYVAEYKANVTRVGEAEISAAIAGALAARSSTVVAVPADLPLSWLPEGLVVVRTPLDRTELVRVTTSITGCAVGVAESGTIVLDTGFAQGPRALTLIPDHHICVVFAEQVVDSIPEAFARLGPSVRAGQPLTWISGPSATSDIELCRVEGVHGPRTLDVLLVG